LAEMNRTRHEKWQVERERESWRKQQEKRAREGKPHLEDSLALLRAELVVGLFVPPNPKRAHARWGAAGERDCGGQRRAWGGRQQPWRSSYQPLPWRKA
jgi:hypothetical protein